MRIDADARAWNFFGIVLFIGMALAIFADVLPWGLAPLAPDAMPFFPFGNRTVVLENLLAAGGEATPHHLYWLICNPLFANKLTYVVDTLVLALAGVYYLRARMVSRFAAWLGGLALGYSSYTFTLFSAGHRGYFHMFGCAVFAFGLLAHCFKDRKPLHFAMLGCCLAWGLPYQADVLAMVVFLAGAYTLWLTCARAGDPTTPPWRRVARVYPGFLITLVVAALIATPGLKSVLEGSMAGRKQQLAESGAGTANATASQTEKRAQYIFATNWSLPPEDIAEFMVPCLFGVDSVDRALPYWGRLGRAYDWSPNRREMPNYRQHTVYLGVVQVLFALLGVFAYVAWRRSRRAGCGSTTATALTAADMPWIDVPFWVAAGVVSLLLALGRYTPCYHAFYAIPYMNLVRDPVKFHHLLEICTASLFGLGVEFWLRNRGRDASADRCRPDADAVLRNTAVVAGILAFGLFLAAAIASAFMGTVETEITQVGLAPLAVPLSQYLVSNLLRSAWLACLAAALLWLGRKKHAARWPLTVLGTALALLMALDAVMVARRFVRPIDVGPMYSVNPVVQTILARGGEAVGVANYLTDNDPNRDWFSSALERNGLRLAIPSSSSPVTAETEIAQALGNRPETLWSATGARYVLAPWSALEPLVQAHVLAPVLTFQLNMRTRQVHVAAPAPDACLLAEYTACPPAASVISAWRGALGGQAQVAAMRDATWNPTRDTVTDAADGHATTGQVARICGTARVTARRGSNFCFATTVETDAASDGLLLIDERYAPDLTARLDGQAAAVHRANAWWCAVPVPAGHHLVVIGRQWHPWPSAISAMTGLLVLAWGLLQAHQRLLIPRWADSLRPD